MAYQINYAYTSHIGKVRANNEDNFWCCGKNLPEENQGTPGIETGSAGQKELPVFGVFDGMGGESCGETASFLASEALTEYYGRSKKNLGRGASQFMEEACTNMNQAVCRYGSEKRIHSMGTTMAMVAFGKKDVGICNLGDSRIYQRCGGQFRRISTDHVAGGGMFGKGPLTQYLGIDEKNMELEPFEAAGTYRAGDRYLICSDGLTDMLSDGELADIFSREISVEETVTLLLERTLKKGGKDNVTIILCEISEDSDKGWLETWVQRMKNRRHGGDGNEKRDAGPGF